MRSKEQRKATAKKRGRIIARDNHECFICGQNKIALLEVHHIHPRYVGGDSEDDNFITLCDQCHFIVPHGATKTEESKEVFHEIFNEFVRLV